MRTGGRAAVVVPDGVLFGSSKAHKDIRKIIVEDQKLDAIIKLPSGVFRPYAGVSTAIMIFTKTESGGTDNVWFYDMEADGLMRDLRQVTSQDAALNGLMQDFEECVRQLKGNHTPLKVKQCIAAQFNLLEALLRQHPNTNGNTFGAMCNETGNWPHEAVKESAQRIYRFASDYPGIRHGGTPANQLREIDMRDMVAMTVVLAGFTPYFSDALNADTIYSD